MKKIIKQIKEKKWIQYLIIVVIGLLVAIPYFWLQLFETDDGYVHILRVLSVGLSTKNGAFPYLITPFFCRNFGYAMSVFYGGCVTYIPYIFSLIVNSVSNGIKIFAGLTIPISGIFMYKFIYEVTKSKGVSFLSALIYMVFPYRLEIYFNRFAFGEISAFMFIPIVFRGLYNLLHGDGKKHYYITIGAVRTSIITYYYNNICCIILRNLHNISFKGLFEKGCYY